MISDYELDRILGGDKALVPSREFTASVMTAVERQLSAPAAMSFPWRRMFAGLVAFVGVLSAAFVGDPSLTDATTAVPPLDPPQALSLASNALNSSHAAWIGLALLVTVVSAQLSSRAVLGVKV